MKDWGPIDNYFPRERKKKYIYQEVNQSQNPTGFIKAVFAVINKNKMHENQHV